MLSAFFMRDTAGKNGIVHIIVHILNELMRTVPSIRFTFWQVFCILKEMQMYGADVNRRWASCVIMIRTDLCRVRI